MVMYLVYLIPPAFHDRVLPEDLPRVPGEVSRIYSSLSSKAFTCGAHHAQIIHYITTDLNQVLFHYIPPPCSYVAWNMHEPLPSKFDFTGILDLGEFIRTAQRVGLHVIVRPGPYICAEWELGGLPA